MRSRPNNLNKQLVRTKSPVLPTSNPLLPTDSRSDHKTQATAKQEHARIGSADVKIRVASPQAPKEQKKVVQRKQLIKDQNSSIKSPDLRVYNLEGRPKTGKQEEENTDNTTQQSSSQHLSYVTGQYQLDSYDLFSRRKNVKFQEKVQDLQKAEKNRGSSKSISRNSSILKNSSRMLDRSLASSEKSISIQNSFTAAKKCKIGLSASQDNGNNLVKKKYESTLEQLRSCRQKGQGRDKYIDELFPPVEASIFSTSVYRKGHISKSKDDIIWMRLSEIFPGNTKVFAKGKQGNVTITRGQKGFAEHYLATGMNAIKNCSELLGFIFEKEEPTPEGIYLVKIYQQNTWKYVIVDDLIPCVRKRGKSKSEQCFTPIFLNVVVPEGQTMLLWPFLLEKAFANYYSSYENLCFGNAIDFISQLVGVPFKELSLVSKKISKEILQKNVSSLGGYFSNEKVVAVGWSDERSQFYPIVLMKESFTGQNIQLGVCDPMNNYQPILTEIVQLPTLVTTIYIYYFGEYPNITSCPVYPPKISKQKPAHRRSKEDKARYYQIPANDTTSLRTFTLFKKTRCCLDLKQKQNRFYWQCGITDYLWVRCLFLQKEYDGGYRWISGRYSNQKHIIFEQTLEAGEYLMIIMVEWRQRHNKELTAVLYSDCDFLKFQRKNYIRQDRILELACMDLAQRLGKLSQINKSICAYTHLCQETALIIENIVNQRTKGEVTIMRSINGLKSKVEILPLNKEFEVDAPQEYGSLQKAEGKKVIGQSIQIDIQKGESFTVVLRMRGGIDRKFFKVFNFG